MANKEKPEEENETGRKKAPGEPRPYNEYLRRFFLNGDFTQRNQEEWELLGWLLRRGWIDSQIADYLGVHRTSIKVWKNKYPDFFQFVKENKRIANESVVFSLYERATGYDYYEQKIHFDKDGNVYTADTVRHVPPDVGAIRYWLNNREPENWKDVVHNQNENKETPMFDKSKLSAADLDKLEELLSKMS